MWRPTSSGCPADRLSDPRRGENLPGVLNVTNILVNLPILLIIYICLSFRGASIQFDEKPANVIVNSTDASESDGKDDDGDEEGEGGADATSEE